MQADFGTGIPGLLCLDGGVLQSSITDAAPVAFTRNLGVASGTFQWKTGGGFSAGAGPMIVNVGGNTTPSTLTWGNSVGSNIVGTLLFGSTTANNVTTFLNPIDLNGADRTIQVDDNLLSAADYAVVSGAISDASGAYGIRKTGLGLLMLADANSYNGATMISGGALQADIGTGIPANSLIRLDGGVLQSNGALTFTQSLGSTGGTFQWTANGGGFSAGAGPMTVNIGGNAQPDTLVWGANVGSQIVGTLKLNSTTAAYTTTFRNNIDLGGGDRVIQVDDNPNSTSDNVMLEGNITGSGSLTISGAGQLSLTGSANSYTGFTTFAGGTVDLAMTTGPAVPGDLAITADNGVTQVRLQGNNQIPSSAAVSFSGAGAESRLILLGRSLTLAGISNADGSGVIENTQDQTGVSNVMLTVNNSADCSFNGALRNTATGSGTITLVKNGTGTLTLSGSNISYTGGTTLSGGKLVLEDTDNAAFLGKNITNLASLEFNASAVDINFSGYLLGSGSLTKSGPRNLTLTGSGINYGGGTTISGGTLVLRDISNGVFLTKGIVNNAALELNATNNFMNFSGVISGSGSLNITGSNKVTLSGTSGNTYTGDTNLSQGILELNKTSGYAIPGNLNFSAPHSSVFVHQLQNNQISPSAVMHFDGGYWPHYELLGHTLTLAGISDPSGTGVIENSQDENGISSNGVLTVNNTENWIYNGYLRDGNFGGSTGKLVLVKSGDGTLTLSGPNSGGYTGGLTVNAGTLDYSGGTLPVCSYTVNGGTLNIGALSQSIGAFLATGGTVDGSGTLTSNSNYDIRGGTVNAVLAGNVGLTKTTAAAATVNAPAYTGTTTVSGGTLNFTGALPGGNYTISNGSLNINSLSHSIGTLQLVNGSVDGNGTLTSSTIFSVQGGAVNANLAGTAGLTKTGPLTVTLNGTNSYTGATTISAGALQADDGAGISSASYLSLNGGVLQSNEVSTFTRSLGSSGNTFQWALSGGGFAAGAGPMTVNIGGGTPLTWGYTPGATICGALKLSSSTAANVTTFQNNIDLNGANRYIQVDDNPGSSADYAVVSGDISNSNGTAAIIKSGVGLLVLTGNNTFNGTTTIISGSLQVGDGGATGVLSGDVTNNTTLIFNRSDDITFSGAIANSGRLIQQGAGMLTLTNANTYSGGTTIASGALRIGDGAAAGSIAGNVTDNGTLVFNRSDSYAFNGAISGTGDVVQQGSGTLTLNAANTYEGGTIINSGTLQIGSGGTTGIISGNIVDNGVLAFNRSNNVTFDGTISGTGSLVQQGTGVLTLTAENSYSGGTYVQSGALAFAAALPGGDYCVSGGTLDLGALSQPIGNLQITAGTLAGLGTLASNADYDVQGGLIEAALGGNMGLVKTGDGVAVLEGSNSFTGTTRIEAGTLALAAGGHIDPLSAVENDGTFLIADGTHSLAAISGTGSTLLGSSATLGVPSIVQGSLTIGGDYGSILASCNSGSVQSAAVPEPSTLALLASLCIALAAAYFRKS